MFVDHITVTKKQVFGTFYKFTFYCNNVKNFVYCHSENDFLKLLDRWNIVSKSWHKSFYSYTYNGENEPISLHDIVSDNKYKVKMYLTDNDVEVSYIS